MKTERLYDRKSSIILFLICALIIYALVYFIAYHVPLTSDDYGFYQKGLSLQEHTNYYLNGSGRYITDWTSSILLRLLDRPVYMAINSLVLIVLIMIISLLPGVVIGGPLVRKGSWVIFAIVFMLYWVSNPNLGTTAFWLVGSANYLWTLMWASIYYAYFLHLLVSEDGVAWYRFVILFALGFAAGLSNEATGLSVVLFTAVMMAIHWKRKKITLIIALISVLTGYAFMILAPGNYVRLDYEGFKYYNELPLIGKIITHVFGRMPEALGGYYVVYIALIVILIVSMWVNNGEKINDAYYKYSLIFGALSVITILSFIVSPAFPPRSQSTSRLYSLMTISFIANSMIGTPKRSGIIFLSSLAALCLIYFAFSYSFVAYAYDQIWKQSLIRESVIEDTKKAGSYSATIPDWYFTTLLKEGDEFDKFRSARMPEYYGMSEIDWKDVTFNYIGIDDYVQIGDKYYFGSTISDPRLKGLKTIDFGFYDPDRFVDTATFTIDLSASQGAS